MNILITGITGMRNRGVEAIIVPTIEQLRLRQPDLKINILTWTPDYDEIRLKPHNVNLTLDIESLRINYHGWKKLLLAKLLPLYKLSSPSSSLVANASTIIASGGDVFSPEYNISTFLQPLKIAIDKNIPIIFFAQSISPYKTDEQAELWLSFARHAKLITAREIPTYKYLTEGLGLSTDIVKLTADPAFLLPAIPQEEVDKILRNYGISRVRPVVAIAASQGICRYASIEDQGKHLESWQKVVKMVLDKLDAEVIIIPHVQEIKPSNDDRIIATDLLRKLNYDPRVHIADADHTASELKGLIAACDLVIAERMHAAIAGLSSGVCTIAVGYSIKAKGIMADLVDLNLLEQGLLISIEDFLKSDLVCEAIQVIWKQRQEISKSIKEKLPDVQKRSAMNFDMLVDFLSEGC
ncbi:MAG: polysaccharide pyruvyl transferase family protein [Nostoc sp. TH1S01]|nr:polysaccharide pyruvyl transferase family protein [Nostoc sp. TH1S01]